MSYRQHVTNPSDTSIPNASQFFDGIKKITAADASGHRWIVDDLKATGGRFLGGLAAGVVASLAIGLLMGCYTPAAAMILPPLTFWSKIPPTAMLALYFVPFGIGEQLFFAIVALGILPSMSIGIYLAVKKDVPQDLIYKSYTLGASHLETVFEVVFKQILPRIFQTLELHIGPAMVFLIATEWIMADIGFGYRLRMQTRLLNLNVVYLYLIILGVSGFLIERGLTTARRKLSPWFGE
jgi:NitT/TauT family transport system permease protein